MDSRAESGDLISQLTLLSMAIIEDLDVVSGLDPEGSFTGGTSSRRLEPSGASLSGVRKPLLIGGGRGCSPGKFFKIYVSENAFQAILKPFFPYSITSVLSKVRQSNPSRVLPIFSHIRRRKLFLGFKILNSDIFWGFQKNEYSFGYEDFVDIFGGYHKIGLYGGHFYVF